LCQYVTAQPNLCMITDRGIDIISALQSEEVGWEGDNLVCELHMPYHIEFQQKIQKCRTQTTVG